jgi:protocatechuate 3,4-dioxygenase beta subunit
MIARRLFALAVLVALSGPAHAQCVATRPDALGPFYEPNAPERASTGRGLVVTGTVRSLRGCAPIPGARIEWWSVNPGGRYDDAHRATQRADPEGRYRYETDPPPAYAGRPPHLHVRITAPGHRTLVTQLYPRTGQRAIESDFVLAAD